MTEIFTEEENNYFNTLYAIDVSKYVEKKKTGRVELTYLSWAWAWAEVKKRFPDANYKIERFGEMKKPYLEDDILGYMVFTTVTIGNQTHEMFLPIMDGANKSMKKVPYTYQVKEYKNGKPTGNMLDKEVEQASMFDVNKTIMRCLVKNLAMFGLGLYIYAGEDLPETPTATKEQLKELNELFKVAGQLLNCSPETFKAQELAHFKYGGKFEDIDESLYLTLKEHAINGINQMKAAQENKEK